MEEGKSNAIRRFTIPAAVAALAAVLFVTGAKADYLQEHWLTSGSNTDHSFVYDSHYCASWWDWEHRVTTGFTFNSSTNTGSFGYSRHWAGDENHPCYDVSWHLFSAWDNYGAYDEDWSSYGFAFANSQWFYPQDTYESDGTSNPIFVRSMFTLDAGDFCTPDSYHILYGY